MTDRELVDKIVRQRQLRCYAEVMGRYGGLVYGKSLSILRRTDWAKDNTQQTFVRAYERLSDWRGDLLGPWLTTIAAHLAVRMLAKEQRYAGMEPTESALRRNEPTAEEVQVHEERLLNMEKALADLPPQDRQIVRLHYYEKKKTDEIAQLLNLSQSNVLVKLHRIRERLKARLRHERNDRQ